MAKDKCTLHYHLLITIAHTCSLSIDTPHSLITSHITSITPHQLRATAALWPFMVPLFVVYFAEYAMQSGTWAAIGMREAG